MKYAAEVRVIIEAESDDEAARVARALAVSGDGVYSFVVVGVVIVGSPTPGAE